MDPLGPASLTWRLMADARTALCGGRALLMQVAHPAVGAAVADHSTFRHDPWPRLWGTVNSALRLTYGGPRAHTESTRLRTLHRDIRGVDAAGTRYHALDPDAYFWVHATLLDSALAAWRHFAVPLTEAEEAQVYREWRHLGRILGIPDHAMPRDHEGFRAHVEEKTATLTPNKSTEDVLHSLTGAVPPPAEWFPEPLWRRLSTRLGAHLTRLTLGTLPPPLRARLAVEWSTEDSLRFARQSDRIRRTMSALPTWARQYPAATSAYAGGTQNRR
ncbi:oxygenase MpaB family protein [Actinokineospora sp. PR83]|uniref:oxygenase MpaB family protein n=1 Tax=Actinokineospora sp. PR83 TaxID=2884908 RepID=UPI002714D642|nr:oxygenase MpaB family protein [Actinokineospora sp. PR83]